MVLRYLPFSAVHQAHVCRVVDVEDALEISLGSHPFGGLLTSSQEFWIEKFKWNILKVGYQP